MLPKIESTLIMGPPRMGKSELALALNVPRARGRDRPAFEWYDPPGSMVRKAYLLYARMGLGPSTIYDPLAETSDVPGYMVCEPSTHPDPDQREAENRETKAEVKALVVKAEGKLDTAKNQVIDEGLDDTLDLFLNQRAIVPFDWLPDALLRCSDAQNRMIEGCTKEKTARKFRWYRELNDRDWLFFCAPAERRLRKVCESPQFRRRCVPTYDHAAFLNAGGIWLGDGASRGNLGRQDLALILSMRLMNTLRLARQGRLTRRVVIIIDEGMNNDQLDMNVIRAAREALKWNVELWVLVHSVRGIRDPEVRDGLLNAFSRHVYMRQIDPEEAQLAGRLIVNRTYDPHLVHSEEVRRRQLHAGFDLKERRSSGSWETEDGDRGKNEGVSVFPEPKYEEVVDRQTKYYSRDEQIALRVRDVSNMAVGEFIRAEAGYVSPKPEYIPMLEDP